MPFPKDCSLVADVLQELGEGHLLGIETVAIALESVLVTVLASKNTGSAWSADRIGTEVRLEEGSFPYEVTAELDTVGPHTFDGVLSGAFTAHPKFCPDTGEMVAFGISGGKMAAMFASHPPLDDRIEALRQRYGA